MVFYSILEEKLLGAMGLATIETDINEDGFLLGQLENGYYAQAKKYYEVVTDETKNTSFWAIDASSPQEQVQGEKEPEPSTYEPLNIGDIVMVDSNTKTFDINTGLKG